MRLIADPFAPGRSSTPRALIALVVAPTIAFLLALPFAVVGLGGDWGGERSNDDPFFMAPLLGFGYLAVLAGGVIVGGLVWLALRASRRESGKAYVIAGAVGGVLLTLRFGGTGVSQAFIFTLSALTGAFIALCFWLIARERETVITDPTAP